MIHLCIFNLMIYEINNYSDTRPIFQFILAMLRSDISKYNFIFEIWVLDQEKSILG